MVRPRRPPAVSYRRLPAEAGLGVVSLLVLIAVALGVAGAGIQVSRAVDRKLSDQSARLASLGGESGGKTGLPGRLPPAPRAEEPGAGEVGFAFAKGAGWSAYIGLKGTADLVNPFAEGFIGHRINSAALALANLAINPREQLARERTGFEGMWRGISQGASSARDTFASGSATERAELAGMLAGMVAIPLPAAKVAAPVAAGSRLAAGNPGPSLVSPPPARRGLRTWRQAASRRREREELLAAAASDETRNKLARLSAEDLAALYPEGGPYPSVLGQVVHMPGFVHVAKQNPGAARRIADAYQSGVIRRGAPANSVADELDDIVRIARHPDDSRRVRVVRGPKGPNSLPEVVIYPTRQLDHNGAFMQPAARGKRSNAPELPQITPDQIIVNGRPLESMDGVMILGGHGARFGIQKLPAPKAARMVVDEAELAKKRGRRIEHVVLDSCSQREASGVVCGLSSGQAIQRAINQELARRGSDASIKVRVASRPGSLYGPYQKNEWAFGMGSLKPALFTSPDRAALGYMHPMEALLAGAAAANVGFFGWAFASHVFYGWLDDSDR